jgi:hypothetical protein
LGEIEERIQHEGIETTKNHPIPIVRKGMMIEFYLYLKNCFMRNYPMQGKLAMFVEEEDRLTPTMEELEPFPEAVQVQKLMKETREIIEMLVE